MTIFPVLDSLQINYKVQKQMISKRMQNQDLNSFLPVSLTSLLLNLAKLKKRFLSKYMRGSYLKRKMLKNLPQKNFSLHFHILWTTKISWRISINLSIISRSRQTNAEPASESGGYTTKICKNLHKCSWDSRQSTRQLTEWETSLKRHNAKFLSMKA